MNVRNGGPSAEGSAAETTIYALASGAGRAGIAVVRLSGKSCAAICEALTRKPIPRARQADLRLLVDKHNDDIIDQAIVIWFPGPRSFTGEDVLEIHLHGGPAVLAHLFDVLGARPDTRIAMPGEFSRRAFLHGRLDLTEAEGLADLIAAETREQASQARRQKNGALGQLYKSWRERLVQALTHVEAEIDFAPDEEVPDGLSRQSTLMLESIRNEVDRHLEDDRGERLRSGLEVAVIGPPNAGKSSLINLLAKRDIAIVTDRPGTTRDILEVPLEIEGYPLTLVDMAGLRATEDVVERIGVDRARRRAEDADIVLGLFDGACWPNVDQDVAAYLDKNTIIAVNKTDLLAADDVLLVKGRRAMGLSCLTGDGIDALVAMLGRRAKDSMSTGDAPLLTRVRHREALRDVREALVGALAEGAGSDLALIAENLRHAVHNLGRITGHVGVEDLLDRIFGEFCIGK